MPYVDSDFVMSKLIDYEDNYYNVNYNADEERLTGQNREIKFYLDYKLSEFHPTENKIKFHILVTGAGQYHPDGLIDDDLAKEEIIKLMKLILF
jgi:hypothetical protein